MAASPPRLTPSTTSQGSTESRLPLGPLPLSSRSLSSIRRPTRDSRPRGDRLHPARRTRSVWGSNRRGWAGCAGRVRGCGGGGGRREGEAANAVGVAPRPTLSAPSCVISAWTTPPADLVARPLQAMQNVVELPADRNISSDDLLNDILAQAGQETSVSASLAAKQLASGSGVAGRMFKSRRGAPLTRHIQPSAGRTPPAPYPCPSALVNSPLPPHPTRWP